MVKEDKLQITVLDDGSVKVVVDGAVSSVNHTSADNLLSMIAKLAGGETEIKKRREHGHTHAHSHSHATAGGHKH